MTAKETLYDSLRVECWNNALHQYGYSFIYSERARHKKKLIKAINFLGIIVPVCVGGIVTTYNLSGNILDIVIVIAGTLSFIQLLLSVLSLNYGWDDLYSYYLESSHDNSILSDDYEKLFKNYPADYSEECLDQLKSEKNKVDLKHSIRTTQDNKYPLTEPEKRKGMRYALRKFRRECAGCEQTPIDVKPTDCPVCGQF